MRRRLSADKCSRPESFRRGVFPIEEFRNEKNCDKEDDPISGSRKDATYAIPDFYSSPLELECSVSIHIDLMVME